MADSVLLEVTDLDTSFKISGKYYDALDGISFKLHKNEILAIVGESGCGKSTIATSIVGLHNMNYTKVSGNINFKGKNLLELNEAEMNTIRGGEIGMIFQDPLSSLNPLMRVGEQIRETLDYHTTLSPEDKELKVLELLDQVGIAKSKRVAKQFPHQLSGGMRQRIVIAIALACKPDLIIADEPTTALDVTIQAQILDLLTSIQKEMHAGIILITHDLGVVAQMADRVAVMYAGQIIELGEVKEIFKNPQHPYTKSLLKSIPHADKKSEDLHVISGMVPSLVKLPKIGCRFAPRIKNNSNIIHEEQPTLKEISKGHFVRCSCWKNFTFD